MASGKESAVVNTLEVQGLSGADRRQVPDSGH